MRAIAYVCSNPYFNLNHASGYSTHIREFVHALDSTIPVATLLPQTLETSNNITLNRNTSKPSYIKQVCPTLIWNSLKDLRRIHMDRLFAQKLKSHIASSHAQLVYERLDFSGPSAFEISRSLKLPYILEIHAPLPEEGNLIGDTHPLSFHFRKKIHAGIRSADAIVVVSSVLKDWVASIRGSAANIYIVNNGVNLSVFDSQKIDPDVASRWIGCQPKPTLGFTGSSLPWHGLPLLFKVLSQIKSPYTLVIAGPAKNDPHIRNKAKELKIDSNIVWTGNVSQIQVAEILSCVDIAILPNANDYQDPVKLYEYGAMGCCVIAPKTRPIEDLLIHQENGLLFERSHENEFLSVLNEAIRNEGLRKRLGEQLQLQIRTSCSWAHRAQEFKQHMAPHLDSTPALKVL